MLVKKTDAVIGMILASLSAAALTSIVFVVLMTAQRKSNPCNLSPVDTLRIDDSTFINHSEIPEHQ
jgi:hypothetical protein